MGVQGVWRGAVAASGSLAVVMAGALVSVPASAATADLVVNGTFSTNTAGWYLSTKGALTWASPGQARLTNNTTAKLTMTLNDQLNTVSNPVVGQAYAATASVRGSSTAQYNVTVRVQEWRYAAGKWTMLGQASKAVTVRSTAWQNVALAYTPKASDSSLDLNVIGSSVPAKAYFEVDNVGLTTFVPDPNVAPTAAFSAVPTDLTVAVDGGGSADVDGQVVSYAWDFGDGSTGSGVTASHTYAVAGTYPVVLTVTDDRGATDRRTKEVTVVKPNVAPTAAFSAVPTDLTVAVDGGGSADVDGQVVSYAWDFGDGSTGSGVTASHTYAVAGTYPVVLTVTDDRGATDRRTKEVTVVKPNVAPTAAFSAVPTDLTVAVDGGGSADVDGQVVSYAWDFGDGSTGSGVTASHTYAVAGDFGDGSTGSGVTASHTYAVAGTYPVVLTVTDDRGATDRRTKEVTVVKPAPPAPAGWKLHWSDEFDGTALNGNNWQAYHNTYGDGNKELACLTPSNVAVTNGMATLTSRKETVTCPSGSIRQYTSGFLGSREVGKYHPLYARYEIRAQIPHGQGLWPAFWLRHRNGSSVAEVDVMEYFYSQVPGKATQTLHFPSTIGRNVAKKSSPFETPVKGTGGWHTYAVEIEPVTGSDGSKDVRFRFLIDDVQTLSYTNPSPEAWNQVNPDAAWDIAINTAVGGNYTGHPEQQLGYLQGPKVCSLTYKAPTNGDPSTCPTTGLWFADMPGKYNVDYVRVFTR
jgi:PKD repeat protein